MDWLKSVEDSTLRYLDWLEVCLCKQAHTCIISGFVNISGMRESEKRRFQVLELIVDGCAFPHIRDTTGVPYLSIVF